jgi:hypothetical protein
MMSYRKILVACVSTLLVQACSGGSDAPVTQGAPDAAATVADVTEPRVFVISPADGATVTSPVTVVFGIENFAVAPAGTPDANTGHHHLLVDTGLPPLDQPIPADENHIHFGKGQTETTLELAAGEHTLQLLLGDGNHVPHDPALVSEQITITVTENPVTIQ